jgi:hypothetical protein
MHDLARTHWCKQVKVSLEVATLDISMPLTVDGSDNELVDIVTPLLDR